MAYKFTLITVEFELASQTKPHSLFQHTKVSSSPNRPTWILQGVFDIVFDFDKTIWTHSESMYFIKALTQL